jgi:3-hydroxyacyl-CoA dehydrogenase
MSELVKHSREGEIAIITIDNPPVNALSPGVPEGIVTAVEQSAADEAVKAMIVVGAGRTFVAGADIREFGKIVAGERPRLSLEKQLRAIEDCPKPVVMAIHGTALGGGLELAMAGHYRVAVKSAQVGQPEVKLGLIPGAGGTQRLPRLAGVAAAVEMCAFGEPVSAAQAAGWGIIDLMVEGDLLSNAVAFARERVEAGQAPPRTRERNEKLAGDWTQVFQAAREKAARRLRGQIAPMAAIDAVEAATRLPFDEGIRLEEELFNRCLYGQQSRALIHVFFGERTVSKVPGIGKDIPILPVRQAAVVGAGTMGGGIAIVYANAGIPVILKEASQEALDRGLVVIRKNLERWVQSGRLSPAAMEQCFSRIQPRLDYAGFEGADIIVEAVFEDLELKKAVFAELDAVARPGAILATNTSTLDIDAIASATRRPDLVIGHHFFSPAHIMRLLEIVRGKATDVRLIATSMELAKRLGKIGVLVGNCRGFVGNRMFEPYRREAVFLVEEGNEPEAIDQALYDWGMAMGPLAVGDLAGLDVGWRIRREFRRLEVEGVRYPHAEDLLCERGWLGQKSGSGWYRYEDSRKCGVNQEAVRIVREFAAQARIRQRPAAPGEIVERTIYALINEGARILEEGIALRPVDIDIIYVNGYGFPAWRGGPMFYADSIGLRTIYERVRAFQQEHGPHWSPAPLLGELAEGARTFADWAKARDA